ncbi:MAG: hypothetical protein ACRDJI_05425 [Actinomycetota bacterium]
MPRTTINLDSSVLRELKRRARKEGKSLGQLISEITATALKGEGRADERPFRWRSRRMVARVDLEDKEAVHKALESR